MPVRPPSVVMAVSVMVAVMTPDVFASMIFASATETVPERATASSPRPEKPMDA